MAIDDLIQDATRRMDKSVEAAQTEFATLRTGRASPALLDRVQIDYYGQQTPLKQLATINAPEPRMITVQPFDPSSLSAIERAIQESDLGLTPSNDGKLIRLPIPQLTEERRKEPPPEGARRQERGRQGRGAPRGGARPEAHRRPHEEDRRAAGAQGSRDPRGLRGCTRQIP
jgi:ribosome recycling factor